MKIQVQTPSIMDPASVPAEAILDLSWLVTVICAVIFVVVGGLLVYGIVRYRDRPENAGQEPPQVYGSNPMEFAWTVIPILIVLVLFLVTTRTIWAMKKVSKPEGAVAITVVGHQWWWEFQYPELGISTANEMHVPASQASYLSLQSADVIHSFWVPRLAGKTDLIPNRTNQMWFEGAEPGFYVGQCAEYCGTQHANMLLRVYVHPDDEWDAWVASQQPPAVDDPAERAGRDLFLSTSCINCHTVRGTVADGRFGPDLTHLMSRETLGAGIVPNDAEGLRAWLDDPGHDKPGVLMPSMQLDDAELDQLVAWMLTLR
jgi:cytochrome c oxidase subunit 2